MHRINYKGGDFDYIDSARVPELFEKMDKRKKEKKSRKLVNLKIMIQDMKDGKIY